MGIKPIIPESTDMLDDSTLMKHAGRSNFIVVIPAYTFDLIETDDGSDIDRMAHKVAKITKDNLDTLKDAMGFSCDYKVVILKHNDLQPKSYPITST
jgi:hypothetical protein